MKGKDFSILLVEDDEVDVMNVRRAFQRNGIHNRLYVSGNGSEALDWLRAVSELPKVILLDINMPVMNGIEFLTELRQDPLLKHLSVFVMTTSNEDSDKIEAYRLNIAGYILKPLSFEKFLDAVKTLDKYWNLTEYP